jgi:hypothetical protein
VKPDRLIKNFVWLEKAYEAIGGVGVFPLAPHGFLIVNVAHGTTVLIF